MAECENCIHQYVCEKRTCAECVSGYCDECELYCQYGEKPDIENCKDFINENNVVPVVRCCDCKHKKENPDINNTWFLTCKLTYGLQGTVDPTDFCSYGERKEDNGKL